MSTRRTRHRFNPDVLRGADRAATNTTFRAEAQRYKLAWTCRDCVYCDPSSGACTVGWPNGILLDAVDPVVDDSGFPAFCKAFEPE